MESRVVSGGAKRRILQTDARSYKPHKLSSFHLEKRDAEIAKRRAEEIERMIEAKVAQALRLLR